MGILPYRRNRRCSSGLRDYSHKESVLSRRQEAENRRRTHAGIDFVLLMRIHGEGGGRKTRRGVWVVDKEGPDRRRKSVTSEGR